ncbi:MAG: peptidoglycan-binding protein [Candidatus Omnitrophica bacterium]|nr:peptidoglycan-binding protein [Candidatus Omnitrophota bacterium]
MKKSIAIVGCGVLAGFLAAGCATSIGGKKESDLKSQVASLETQVIDLNQKIQELAQRQAVLETTKASPRENFTPSKPKTATSLTNREIQLALKSAGYYDGAIDGKLGPKTKEAVRAFQHSQGLAPDGVVGSKTASALSKYLQGQKE